MGRGDVSRPAYFLTPHTFVARVEEAAILLDSRSDDYILIDARLAPGFFERLSGETSSKPSEGAAPDADLDELIDGLAQRGSITSRVECGQSFEALEMITGNLEIPGPRIDAIPRIGAGHVISMLISLLMAIYLLKIRGLPTAIRHVSALRAKRTLSDSHLGAPEAVEVYNRIKPLFHGAKNACLFNSLSMIIFLDRYGIRPYWCFGVKLNPFEAHCWIEDDRWLYNDRYSRTWRFAPIMRV